VPDMVLICAALFLSMFAMPIALMAIVLDGIKKSVSYIEID
jgi:hypothetical protein